MKLIIMATFLEAKPFLELMSFTKLNQTPFPAFQQEDMILVISGIGKVNAAMAATYGCINFRPDYVFNFGAAGATGTSAFLGGIYQIGTAIEYDGFDLKTGIQPIYTPEILPGFQTVTIATQDIPVLEKKHRETVSVLAPVVDMEASAIIQVCQKLQIRCYLFKFVTDTPDHHCKGDIRKHIRKYRLSFYQFISGSVFPALLLPRRSEAGIDINREDDND
jgi:adenosylhomocysteine nucleosidase